MVLPKNLEDTIGLKLVCLVLCDLHIKGIDEQFLGNFKLSNRKKKFFLQLLRTLFPTFSPHHLLDENSYMKI